MFTVVAIAVEGLATYYFSLVDMVGTVGTTDNDELIKVVYDQGSDLEWSMLFN